MSHPPTKEPAVASFVSKACPYCGKAMGKRGKYKATRDHAHIPKSKGGKLHGRNRVIACRSCNASKKDYPLIQWHDRLKLDKDPRATKVAAVLAQHHYN